MGLIKNLKKTFKKSPSTVNDRVRAFPSIIDESIKPVDVAKEEPKKKEIEKINLDLPKLNIVKKDESKEVVYPKNEDVIDSNKNSFFLNLYKEVNTGKLSESDFLNENVLLKMKDYWKNDSSVIQNQSENEQRKSKLREMVNETLKELTGLEDKWRSLRIEQERINSMVKQVEAEVEADGLKFKELVKKLKFHENVVPDKKFKLFDGREINNLFELLGALKMMSDNDFKNHVNEDKNDFAAWVETSLNEPDVANEMKNSKDKSSMIKFLEVQLSHENLK